MNINPGNIPTPFEKRRLMETPHYLARKGMVKNGKYRNQFTKRFIVMVKL